MRVDDETLLMAGIFAVAAFGGCVAIGTPIVSTALASRSWISIPIHSMLSGGCRRSVGSRPTRIRQSYVNRSQRRPFGGARRSFLPSAYWSSVEWPHEQLPFVVDGQEVGPDEATHVSCVDAARDGGVVLGTHDRSLLAVESRHSLLVVGATQTHKTTGLAVPAILEADDKAIIAVSVKDDLVADTIGWRSQLDGDCWVFDPTNVLSSHPDADLSMLSGDDLRHAQLRPRIVRVELVAAVERDHLAGRTHHGVRSHPSRCLGRWGSRR